MQDGDIESTDTADAIQECVQKTKRNKAQKGYRTKFDQAPLGGMHFPRDEPLSHRVADALAWRHKVVVAEQGQEICQLVEHGCAAPSERILRAYAEYRLHSHAIKDPGK